MSLPLQLSLSLPSVIGAGELPVLNLRLEHHGDARRYVPIRFAAAPLGDLRLEVTCDGREVPFRSRLRLGPLRPSDYVAVEPGEVLVAGYSLAQGYDVSPAGLYVVAANLCLGPPPAALGDYLVGEGEVEAEPVRMRVRP